MFQQLIGVATVLGGFATAGILMLAWLDRAKEPKNYSRTIRVQFNAPVVARRLGFLACV
jgi:hypothetical protein